MLKLIAASCVTLSFLAFAQGTPDPNATGDFSNDLGQLLGAIRAVKQVEEICTESFPALRDQNGRAYLSWRSRNLAFVHEVEKIYQAWTWRAAKGNTQEVMALYARMDKQLDEAKLGLRNQLTSGGRQKFSDVCDRLPAYFASEPFDIEHHYAEQVQTVRQGSK